MSRPPSDQYQYNHHHYYHHHHYHLSALCARGQCLNSDSNWPNWLEITELGLDNSESLFSNKEWLLVHLYIKTNNCWSEDKISDVYKVSSEMGWWEFPFVTFESASSWLETQTAMINDTKCPQLVTWESCLWSHLNHKENQLHSSTIVNSVTWNYFCTSRIDRVLSASQNCSQS